MSGTTTDNPVTISNFGHNTGSLRFKTPRVTIAFRALTLLALGLALVALFSGCPMTALDRADTALNLENWQHARNRALGYVTPAGLFEPGLLADAKASPSTIKVYAEFYTQCVAHAEAMKAAAEKAK